MATRAGLAQQAVQKIVAGWIILFLKFFKTNIFISLDLLNLQDKLHIVSYTIHALFL